MQNGSGMGKLPPPARLALASLAGLAAATLLCAAVIYQGGFSGVANSVVGRESTLLSIAGINIGNLAQVSEGEEAPGFPVGDDVQWLNTPGSDPPHSLRGMPLDMKHMQNDGKQVLIHFWDYTDLESLKSLATVRRIHKYYESYGLEVISVHRSHYEFASMLVNLAEAVTRLEISHPVVNDKDGDIAAAYGSVDVLNFFLIDEHNIVRSVHGGKGSAEKVEHDVCSAVQTKFGRIQCAASLSEHGMKVEETKAFKGKQHGSLYIAQGHFPPAFPLHSSGRAACRPSTSEILVGHNEGKGSLTARQQYPADDKQVQYTDLSGVAIADGSFVLSGDWISHEDGLEAVLNPTSGLSNNHLRLRYHGKEVMGLMGVTRAEEEGGMCADGVHGDALRLSPCAEPRCENEAGAEGFFGWCRTGEGHWGGCIPCKAVEEVKVYVQMDGEALPLKVRGKDVEEDALGRTYVSVLEPRIYFLVDEHTAWPRGLELIPAAAGVTMHSFSFAGNCAADWDHKS